MSPSGQVDLSVIIVNYNVASLVLQAVASLERQKFAGPNGRDGRLEILVIDNASSPEDVACLKGLPPSVILLRNEQNLGFAAATNQGIERSSGRYLCFLNPDTKVLDGALEILLQHLYQHPEVGAVGPRIWADDERTLCFSPLEPPTLSFMLARLLGSGFPLVGPWHTRQWHRLVHGFWRSQMPVTVPMLSGACIVTSRMVVGRVGRFDPCYFLFYEDADWCRRVRRAGYRLVCVPGAEVIHYYHQSARQDPLVTRHHARGSRDRFVGIHYGRLGVMAYKAVEAIGGYMNRWWPPDTSQEIIDLGYRTEPPRLCVEGVASACELMVQIGVNECFIPSAAAFTRIAEFQISKEVWGRMPPGRYYAAIIDAEALRSLAIWSWVKG